MIDAVDATQPKHRGRRLTIQRGERIALYVVMGFLSLVFLIPLIWLVTTSVKAQGEVFAYPPVWIPESIQWSNFSEA
ncbi:MAG: hypothetical protein H0T72_13005, partial [Chloroflexia bacterium]|nr:hypothetical protein [Chloroflexia bacterium]